MKMEDHPQFEELQSLLLELAEAFDSLSRTMDEVLSDFE